MSATDTPLPAVILAHGASGTAESMGRHVEGLRERGLEARAIELPRRGRAVVSAEAAVPTFAAATTAAHVVGGHSYGGRVASMLAAAEPRRGLVLLSYPLHAPGRIATWEQRTAHWPAIRCPVLLLSGEADPFARLRFLRDAVARLPQAELVTYPGVRHGLLPVLDEALDRVAAFVRSVAS